MQISRFLSQKIRFYTFVCIVLLLFVHGYNLRETYLTPFSTVKESLTFTAFFEYLISNGLLRFRIPLLFMISGYIYALQDSKPYWERARKRATTLLIPFLLWSAFGLLLTFLLQRSAYTYQFVQAAQLDQLGDNRVYEQVGIGGVIFRWLLAPISFQLWFIIALFIYNMLYPGIRWMIVRYPWIWIGFTAFLWLSYFNFMYVGGQGLFFFSVGVYIQKANFNIERKPRWMSTYICFLVYVSSSVIKTFMAFELDPEAMSTFISLHVLHSITILSGILAIWYGADVVVKWCLQQPWFLWLSGFSFFIYGFHAPMISFMSRWLFSILDGFQYYRLATYFLTPLLVVLICIGVGLVLRKTLPSFYRLLTGGRGF